MNTEACDRCNEPAAKPLLRTVELGVDGDRVDDQTLCPDCFSQWISRYQAEMASETAQPDTEPDAGDDITIAEETEPAPDIGTGSNVLDQTVANAENHVESGDDIKEVGGKPPQGPGTGDGVEIDLADESDDEDDGGLF